MLKIQPPNTASNETRRPLNERLILWQVRRAGALSKAELARATGLTAQSASVIVNRLVDEGLLQPGEAVKGKIGQPSIPFSLAPNGALSIGVKIGRRSLEIASMLFDYSILHRLARPYEFPEPEKIREYVFTYVDSLLESMNAEQRSRVLGIGIAIPDELSAWEETIGAPKGTMAAWSEVDLSEDVQSRFDLPVSSLNDASAACLSELSAGNSAGYENFVYIYVGTFIGGGIAIGGQLFNGANDRAGALASLPTGPKTRGMAPQLLEGTSLHFLEEKAKEHSIDQAVFYDDTELSVVARDLFNEWLSTAATEIAFAASSAQAFLDPEAIILDSSLSRSLTLEIVEAVRAASSHLYDNRGLAPINIVVGENGISARAMGSGIVPFLAEYDISPR